MLKNLDNNQLLVEIKNLIREEKRITQLVLDYLAEVEHRRLYALRGYSSLFEFCVKELGYSESSAFRRVSAMRLIKSIPEAKAKLEEGSVNLSTLSQLQSFIKKGEKSSGVKLDLEQKADLLSKIENKSQSQCEKEFIKINPEIIKTKESERPVTESLTEVKFMASNTLMAKLDDLRNILSHRDVHSMAGLIEELADLALKKFSPKESKRPQPEVKSEVNLNPHSESQVESELKNSAAEVHNDTPCESTPPTIPTTPQSPSTTTSSRYIPQKLKNEVWLRDHGECQYVDPLTKRKCKCKSNLQFDHKIPLAKGGATSMENIRLLCSTHNQLEAIQYFSRKHMEQFVPSLH